MLMSLGPFFIPSLGLELCSLLSSLSFGLVNFTLHANIPFPLPPSNGLYSSSAHHPLFSLQTTQQHT